MEGNIRRFGLDHCDFPTIMWNVAVLLRVNGINIDKNYKRIPWILYVFNIVIGGSYVYVFVLSMFWFSFIRCPQTGDYTAAAVEYSIAACSGTCITKLVYMMLYSDTVINLVDDYLQCDSLVVPNTRFANNILKHLRIVKKRAVIVWVSIATLGSLFAVIPHFYPGRHLPEDLFVIYGLEPMFESPNYELAHIGMTFGICFGILTLVNITVLIIVIVGYIEAQILALSEELLYLWEGSGEFYKKYQTDVACSSNDTVLENKIKNMFIKKHLIDIIKFHILCICLRDRVERELRYLFIVEFLIMISGIVAELLGGLEYTYLQLPYSYVQLFMDCFIGQRLLDASNYFEYSLYACNWDNFNVDNRRTVLFMLQCSQKTLSLSAGGVAVLSFSSLMSAMKMTYSMYTTLQSRVA